MIDIKIIFFFIFIIVLLWLPQAAGQVFSWAYWWQVKEYRFDRFWVFLKTKDGQRKLGVFSIVVKLLSLTFAFISPFIPFLVFLLLYLQLVKNIFKKELQRPVITERIKKIYATSIFGMIVALMGFYFIGILRSLILGELLLILTPYLGILWTVPIVNKVKKEEIRKAKLTLQRIKPVVIGITGSYGKTTTKEFVHQILSQKFKTAKTEGSENTEFGIARKTQKNVTSGTKYFVVEMGAYKMGEVKKLCSIVSPKIGIITGIEPQHFALFGSLENIKKAKFELIESLPKNGIAIFNLSNRYCRELYLKAKKLNRNLKVYGYELVTKGKVGKMADLYSKIDTKDPKGISFTAFEKGKRHKLFAPVYGEHFVENLTGTILVSRLLKLSWDEITDGVSKISLPDKTMNVIKKSGNRVVIDDSHNSSPHGFKAALKYLNLYKDFKKIVVTPGIIELGNESAKVHRELAGIMSVEADSVFVTNEKPHKEMKNFIDKNKLSFIKDSIKLSHELKTAYSENSVVLLEGKVQSNVLDKFLKLYE